VLKTALCVAGGAAAGAGIVYLVTRKTSIFGDVPPPIPPAAIATYVRQIRRYAFASSQDKSPIVGLTHASYALILLETAEEIVGRDKVRASGVDVTKLRQFIAKLQDMHAEALKKCDTHLQQVLAIERGEGLPELPGHVVAGAPTGA
jgi:hypothetical protein